VLHLFSGDNMQAK